jgi:hypothetical protein
MKTIFKSIKRNISIFYYATMCVVLSVVVTMVPETFDIYQWIIVGMIYVVTLLAIRKAYREWK